MRISGHRWFSQNKSVPHDDTCLSIEEFSGKLVFGLLVKAIIASKGDTVSTTNPAENGDVSGGSGSDSAGSYDGSNIRHLKGVEGIRTRPAMYIGDTGLGGLHHLVYEVVDNSIDEAVNGKASEILVQINLDESVSIIDDGRGIPVGKVSGEDRSALEVVLTEIHAGGKFYRSSGYKTGTGGLHGVGITAVNALSSWLTAEIRREGFLWTMDFEKGRRTS